MDIIENNNFFSLNTETLEFVISSRTQKDKPEFKLYVQNNQIYPIALRVKTTKKDNYNVVPTYTIIPPQAKIDIIFYLYLTENFDEKAKHKFLIEAIFYDEKLKIENPKNYFEHCSTNKSKLNGKTAKLMSVFKFGNVNAPILDRNSKLDDSRTDDRGEIRKSRNAPSIDRFESIVPENTKANNENEIEDIKSEFYKLSNKLSNLTEQNKELKQKLENEKTFINTPGSFSVEEYTGEKEYSRNFMYIAFAFSVILGFILSR